MPTVGMIGGGQLARMTAQAAISLGVPVHVLAERVDDSAARVTPHIIVGPATSATALASLASVCDVVTFDHELVDVALMQALEADGATVRPSPATVAVAQDKERQRAAFEALALPSPPHARVTSDDAVAEFGAAHGWPVVLKAARGGYDGRGVWVVDEQSAAGGMTRELRATGIALLVEQWIAIEREVAVLVARRPGGETVTYPVVETVQRDGICHEVLAPAALPTGLIDAAARLAATIATGLDVTGILAVELFATKDGRLLINEIATRPHNSGHYSIEGCVTSQFENHLRAVLDWPLGDPALVVPAVATVNVLGTPHTNLGAALPTALGVRGARVHLYGKEARPGRKLGHVTVLGSDIAEARARAQQAAVLLAGLASTTTAR